MDDNVDELACTGAGVRAGFRLGLDMDTDTDTDDLVFRSCCIASCSQIGLTPTPWNDALSDILLEQTASALTSTSTSASASVPASSTSSAEDLSLPSLQPGAGIYTSPLTMNVTKPIDSTQRVIRGALKALQMPFQEDSTKFKFRASAYFTSGYARFSVRIWRRSRDSGSDSYAVEVMRERGDRIVVTRFFELLTSALLDQSGGGVLDVLSKTFSVDMFDWAPRKLPQDVLDKLPVPSADAVAAGISSMTSMVASQYDDVAVNGCASVAKLAAASERTRFSMAQSRELISALEAVAFGDAYKMSMDTRTNAVLALSELLVFSVGHSNFLQCVGSVQATVSTAPTAGHKCGLARLAQAVELSLSSEPYAEADFELAYFRHYCTVAVANMCAIDTHPEIVAHAEVLEHALTVAMAADFFPTSRAATAGLVSLRHVLSKQSLTKSVT